MAKRLTKEEYIEKIMKLAKVNQVNIKTKLATLEKVNLSTKLSIYHKDCKKTRKTTVKGFLSYPECQYCAKVNKNKTLIDKRMKAYSRFPMPKKGEKVEVLELPKLKKFGPLKRGKSTTNKDATKGELEVARVLKDLRVPYVIEYPIFLNRYSKTPLRADFCVTLNEHKYLIEYDGEQHFRAIPKYGGYRGHYRTLRLDEAKDLYVRRNKSYSILRIPYWEFPNIEYHIRKYLKLL